MIESVKGATKSALGRISAVFRRTEYAEDLVGYTNSEFERRRNERRPWELQWRLNIAFVDGNQYLDIIPGLMDLQETPKAYWWQEREVFNHIAPIIETRVARFARMQPTLKVRPATNESADLAAAKIGARLLDYTQNERMPPSVKQVLFQWMEVTGTAFIKNIWDPRLGAPIGVISVDTQTNEQPVLQQPKTNLPQEGLEVAGKRAADELEEQFKQQEDAGEQVRIMPAEEGGLRAETQQVVREGDVNVVIVPAYEIFPDSPWNPNVQSCQDIMHVQARHVDQIYEMWGVYVEPEEIECQYLQATTQGAGGLGYGFGWRLATMSKKQGYALVKELWERPSMRYPQGRLIVVAGNKVLHYGPLSYRIGPDGQPDLPFVRVPCIERPGCFWGRSIVERLIPLQRRFNALKNRQAEYLNRCAIGQVAIEEGSVDLDDAEANAGSPGYLWVYKRGFNPPKFMDNPPLPFEFAREERSLLDQFSIISGVSEIARHSEAPPGVKSGVALSIAVEQDDTRLSHTVSNYESALVQAGKQWLRLYRQFATHKRLLRSVGRDLEVELMEWDRTMIRSDDVIVETSALLAESPAQRRQMIYELLTMGLFNDPNTGKLTKEGQIKIFELLQFGNWEFFDDTEKLQMTRADRENKYMAEGYVVPIRDVDDDVVHLQRHTRFRLTDEYDAMIRANPQIDEMFRVHTQMHLMRLQERVAQMAAQQNQQH